MIDHRSSKNEKYRIHLLERWFPVTRLTTPTVIGTFSLTSLASMQRWMLIRDSFNYGGGAVTPTDISRDYLETKFGKDKRRIGTMQYRNFYDHRRNAPLLAIPQEIDHAYYVDIRGAYWSILQAVGWNVDYMPDKWLRVLSDCSDFPFPDIKMARNCLVSIAADGSSTMRIWTGNELIFRKAGNKFVNRMLWTIVCDVLNSVAYECIEAGAAYCFTDGFIVPANRRAAVEDVIASWGLTSGIKAQGQTIIKGAGAYKVGEVVTKKYDIGKPRSIRKIAEMVNRDWLKKRFAKFANR